MHQPTYQQLYLRRAQRVALLLAGLPFIRLVGLNGSVARHEAKPESDIDFLILTTPGRMFTIRLLATGLVHMFGLRRHGSKIAGRICLNRYQTTNHLMIEPANEYHARVFSQLIPLVDIDGTYEQYQAANAWMAEQFQLPAASPKRRPSRSLRLSQYTRRFGEWLLGGWFGNRLESWTRAKQLARIRANPLTVRYPDRIRTADDILLFHPPAAGEIDEDSARWDAAAEEYDLLQGRTGSLFRRTVVDPVILARLGEVSGQQILDAGCGNGYLVDVLSGRGAESMGVDSSAVMIARARQNFPGRNFQVGNIAQSLIFADQSFDAIICSMVLQDVADPSGALRELHRLLRKTGKLILTIPHPSFAYPAGVARRGLWRRLSGQPPILTIDNYLVERRVVVPVAGLQTPTARYHRPLRRYWELFAATGWQVTFFDEPVMSVSKSTEVPRGRSFVSETIPLVAVFELMLSGA